jgi:hypothetical protein
VRANSTLARLDRPLCLTCLPFTITLPRQMGGCVCSSSESNCGPRVPASFFVLFFSFYLFLSLALHLPCLKKTTTKTVIGGAHLGPRQFEEHDNALLPKHPARVICLCSKFFLMALSFRSLRTAHRPSPTHMRHAYPLDDMCTKATVALVMRPPPRTQ